MKKVMVVFGTRPEAIKMAPLVKQLEKVKDFETVVCITAQHREMLDQVLDVFDINPKYDLDIMKQNQSLSYITSSILNKIDSILRQEQPDVVLVHGDTTTTFVTSLAAFYNRIKVGHVEAGLRTYKKFSPYPEEVNRQMVGIVADYHFAPTIEAKANLLNEGKDEATIIVTGNTAIDTLSYTIDKNYKDEYTEWVSDSKLILLTAHRRENLGRPMENIFKAMKRIVENNKDVKVIYPVHKNPVIREYAKKYFDDMDRIRLIEPLDVVRFHNLISKAFLVLTDSGGIQEEAPALDIPVLVLRNDTERGEGVKANTLKLVGTDTENIVRETEKLLNSSIEYNRMAESINPYGNGDASEKIVEFLKMKL